jgi:hypothetical protein
VTEALTADERVIVDEAMARGYLPASGRRLQVLRAFKARCRRQARLDVIVRQGRRDASVWIGDRRVWKGRPGDAEAVALDHARHGT